VVSTESFLAMTKQKVRLLAHYTAYSGRSGYRRTRILPGFHFINLLGSCYNIGDRLILTLPTVRQEEAFLAQA
jgi:hypothetical protein